MDDGSERDRIDRERRYLADGMRTVEVFALRKFRGHHTRFGERPRRQVPRALINGGRIYFCQPSGPGQQASAGIPGRCNGQEATLDPT